MTENTNLKRTPLFEKHLEAGARMVDFAGWSMPLHYSSQIAEHLATRRCAGLFDVSHMGQIALGGPGALGFLQIALTRDLARLRDGEEAYALMCGEDGGMLDDLFAARLGEEEWLLIVNAATCDADAAHLRVLAGLYGLPDAHIRPCSEEWAMLAVQGPRWAEVCEYALDQVGNFARLPRNHIHWVHWRGASLLLSTTGYTGEPGCELLCPPRLACELWDELTEAGARPAGLAARDSLRLEMGYLLGGQDFTPETNPYEAGVGWAVQMNKTFFYGQDALREIAASGPRRRLVGLLPEGRRIARHGARVLAGEREVGQVTSGGYSVSLERPIALAIVDTAEAEPGHMVELDIGNARLKATIAKPPFYLKAEARAARAA